MDTTVKEKSSVIIVDNDRDLLETIKKGFSLEGYKCETSTSATLALEHIEKTFFDIMIADVVIAETSGYELTNKAKRLRPDMAVILMTGFVDDFSYDKAIEAGASDFIKKPFTLKELIMRIQNVKMQEEFRNLSIRDELTKLYNRRGFFTVAEHILKISKRKSKGIYMLYADLDNLKNINDTWGHQEGDLALIEAAQILQKNYRESDVIARIGGDEFVVFPVAIYGDKVENIIDRLQKAVESYNVQSNRGYKLSLSAGIAFYDPNQPCSIDGLLSQADKSMYKWKRNKQNS